MRAIFSGQAGLAVVLSEPPQFRPVDSRPYIGTELAIGPAFAGFDDVQELYVSEETVGELDKALEQAWSKDRALYRLYMLFDEPHLLDPKLELEIVSEYWALINRYDIRAEMEVYLDEVELGPAHLARATELAIAHTSLRPSIFRLYPQIQSSVEDELERQRLSTKALNEARTDGRDRLLARAAWRMQKLRASRSLRPSTPAEIRAKQALRPILAAAKRSIHIGAMRQPSTSLLTKVSSQVLKDFEKELVALGLESEVKPYSISEIRKLLVPRLSRSRSEGLKKAAKQRVVARES